jgi:hypothetical protein
MSKAVAKSVSGRKARKASLKTTALLSDLEMDEEEDISGDDDDNEAGDDEGHGSGKAWRKGPLTAEALAECDTLGEKIEAMVRELADKHQESPRYILKCASLALSFSQKYNFWIIHQMWFYSTQAEEGGECFIFLIKFELMDFSQRTLQCSSNASTSTTSRLRRLQKKMHRGRRSSNIQRPKKCTQDRRHQLAG